MRYLTLAVFALLGAGLSGASPQSSPAEVLEIAVSQVVKEETRRYETEKYEKINNERVRVPASENDRTATDKLSLPRLLRKGRHQLAFGSLEYTPHGAEIIVIKFVPWPEEKQLRPGPGENKDYDKVMSNVQGEVWVDPTSGGIMEVKILAPEPIPITRVVKVFEIHTLKGTIAQKWDGTKWMPNTFELYLRYWRRSKWPPFLGYYVPEKDPAEFQTRFICK